MQWLKERIFEFQRQDPNYVDVDHVFFLLHRSDGVMFYQLDRTALLQKCDVDPGGRLAYRYERFLNETTNAPKVDAEVYSAEFERLMRKYNGTEITRDDLPETQGVVNASI
jgi:hypothetical protein